MGLLDPKPDPTCDPAPDAFWTEVVARGNGLVIVTINYGWDGVSVRETGCHGPVISVRLQNMGPDTWFVVMPNGRKLKKQSVTPGTDVTFTGQQLVNLGLETVDDIRDVNLVRS